VSEPFSPLVSVVIPAFNAAATIIRALESVRAQNCPGVEIIVVDDCSADDTVAVVLGNIKLAEWIRVVKMALNGGASAARNAGIRVATGKYLAFLDADDVWLPGKLQKQIALIESDPRIALVSCNSELVSPSGQPLKEGHRNRPPVEGSEAWKTLLAYNFLPTPTVMTHRQLVNEVGGFDESLVLGEDLDLWIKLALRGTVAVSKEILVNYFDTPDSLSKRHSRDVRHTVVPMVERHIAQQRSQLTSEDVRRIRGTQAFEFAINLYFSGAYLQSIPEFVRASFYGRRPVKSLVYLPRALIMETLTSIRRANPGPK
jgi:glycosyltransferase involved in cell wall biosynthesis